MTYKEAIAQGYKPADRTHILRTHIKTQPYISALINLDDAEVQEAKGKRKGQLYCAWNKDRKGWIERVYLTK